MPVYDYKCSKHGVFSDLATIEQAGKPAQCPHCGELCAQVIVLPPSFQDMAAERRQAHETNEKSQHEPLFSDKDRREHDTHHGHRCGCSSHAANATKSNLMYTAQGDKMFPSMRPWMISH